MFIGRVGLRVRNLEGMIRFYQQIIGLEMMGRTQHTASLGTGGVTLIELASIATSWSASTDAAGLYHVAFEMPTRTDLARWVAFVAKNRFQVSGLADHLVTESVYISDPDGNGIEMYVSRPESEWMWANGHVAMGVYDLDIPSLLQSIDVKTVSYSSAPASMRIGHIHLKVGDVDRAEAFYSRLIGFDVTRRAPGVVFMSSGQYHHHVAANTWESEGAGLRGQDSPGLSWFSITVRDHSTMDRLEQRLKVEAILYRRQDKEIFTEDPWNNTVRFSLT